MQAFTEFAVIGDSAGRRIFSPDQLDQLGEALIALTSELWIVTDRLAILEAVLQDRGINVADAIDSYQPSPEMEKKLDEKRDKLISNVLAALKKTSAAD